MSYVIDAKIAVQGCPYLGRCGDRETFYAFPSFENYCYTEGASSPIEPGYQADTCLAKGWPACPRYEAAQDGTRPQLTATGWQEWIRARHLFGWAIVAVVAGACLITGLLLILPP